MPLKAFSNLFVINLRLKICSLTKALGRLASIDTSGLPAWAATPSPIRAAAYLHKRRGWRLLCNRGRKDFCFTWRVLCRSSSRRPYFQATVPISPERRPSVAAWTNSLDSTSPKKKKNATTKGEKKDEKRKSISHPPTLSCGVHQGIQSRRPFVRSRRDECHFESIPETFLFNWELLLIPQSPSHDAFWRKKKRNKGKIHLFPPLFIPDIHRRQAVAINRWICSAELHFQDYQEQTAPPFSTFSFQLTFSNPFEVQEASPLFCISNL